MTTVSRINITANHITPIASFLSSKKPKISGPITPPRLNPVETIPKVRPSAPTGDALRTNISRDGAMTPIKNPAQANEATTPHADISIQITIITTNAALPNAVAATAE